MKWWVLLCLNLWWFSSFGQGDTVFFHTMGSINDEVGVAIKPWGEHYLILGNSGDDIFENNSNVLLVWANKNGEVLKSIVVGSQGLDIAKGILVNSKKEILVNGISNVTGNYQSFATVVDSMGNKLYEDFSSSISGQYLGGFISGDTFKVISQLESNEIQILSLETTNWSQSTIVIPIAFETVEFDKVSFFLNRMCFTGSYLPDTSDSVNAIMMTLNNQLEWMDTLVFHTSGNDYFYDVSVLSDSSWILVGGSSGNYPGHDLNILISKFNYEGVLLNHQLRAHNVNGNNADDYATSVFVNENDSVFMLGVTETYGEGEGDIFMSVNSKYLAQLDGATTKGTQRREEIYDALPFENGFIAIGSMFETDNGGSDILFLKRSNFITSSAAQVVFDFQEIMPQTIVLSVDNVPSQPFEIHQYSNHSFIVSESQDLDIKWRVINVLGTTVQTANGNSFQLSDELSSGVYFIEARSESREQSQLIKCYVGNH